MLEEQAELLQLDGDGASVEGGGGNVFECHEAGVGDERVEDEVQVVEGIWQWCSHSSKT